MIKIPGDLTRVERVADSAIVELIVARPERVRRLLDNDALVRLDGRPLVVVSERYRVLGLATGPGSTTDGPSFIVNTDVARLPGPAEHHPYWFLVGAQRWTP